MVSKIHLAEKAGSLNGQDMEEADLCLVLFIFALHKL